MICNNCQREFAPVRTDQLYCSPSCQRRKNRPDLDWRSDIGRGNSGAYSELIAAACLFRHGYYVFRNLGPHGPCDLIALKDGICLRVEVKTEVPFSNQIPTHKGYQLGKDYDVMSVVGFDGEVTFYPELKDA